MSLAPSLLRSRVLWTGLAVAGLLLWIGRRVENELGRASEGLAESYRAKLVDSVVLEWGRLAASREPPVPVVGARLSWRAGEEALEPAEREPPASRSVLATLLAEAERREVVEGDFEGALALVQDGLAKEPDSPHAGAAWLRVLQLAKALGRPELAREAWTRLVALETEASCGGVPCVLLGALVRPTELAGLDARPLVEPERFERLLLAEDSFSIRDEALVHEPAPLLVELAERLALAPPDSAVRAARAALARGYELPECEEEGRWRVGTLLGVPLLVRREGDALEAFAFRLAELEERLEGALADSEAGRAEIRGAPLDHARIFQVDLGAGRVALGEPIRAPRELSGTPYALVVRRNGPDRLVEEIERQQGLFGLSLNGVAALLAVGGFVLARSVARERKLAELKSSFIAGVSHDLRTPIAAIALLCENLEAGIVVPEQRVRYLAALRRETGRLRRLVDDVLDFARLERGQGLNVQRESVALAPFVVELEAVLGERVRAAGREFAGEHAALDGEAWLDPHLVRRALENLVDNALKHGTGRVSFGCRVAEGFVLFTLADEGPGIPAAERERIFRPFERLTGRTHVGGVGLGLAIVRAIAVAHGGQARVRAGEGGRGTVFELEWLTEEPKA